MQPPRIGAEDEEEVRESPHADGFESGLVTSLQPMIIPCLAPDALHAGVIMRQVKTGGEYLQPLDHSPLRVGKADRVE